MMNIYRNIKILQQNFEVTVLKKGNIFVFKTFTGCRELKLELCNTMRVINILEK